MKKFKKRLIITLALAVMFSFFIAALIFVSNREINSYSRKFTYSDLNRIPFNEAGLLLGTGKYLKPHVVNLYYAYRIKAASELYKAGKVKIIIVSGNKFNNEPKNMRLDLIKSGVPASAIYSDLEGFRTYDSVVRCSEVFGFKSFTVISQDWHNERAIFIARKLGLDAIGYNARDVKGSMALETDVRELFSRVKVFIDLYL
ncbi:MAG TPA: ElyC/SanA/YdcF family protein [Ignavibacteriales bacterium]|nr:ElyC/SanA/YdcF family protein [Ignavibacteriales bacterium]